MKADGEITEVNAAVILAFCDFAEENNCTPACDLTADLWGYGSIPVKFVGPGKTFWYAAADLPDIVGLDYADVLDEWRIAVEGLEDGDRPNIGVLTVNHPDGEVREIPMADNNFAFEVMAGRSPWAAEFMKSVFSVFRMAAVQSGLADVMTVVEVSDDGTPVQTTKTLRDLLGDDVPTADEARERAFRGPVIL